MGMQFQYLKLWATGWFCSCPTGLCQTSKDAAAYLANVNRLILSQVVGSHFRDESISSYVGKSCAWRTREKRKWVDPGRSLALSEASLRLNELTLLDGQYPAFFSSFQPLQWTKCFCNRSSLGLLQYPTEFSVCWYRWFSNFHYYPTKVSMPIDSPTDRTIFKDIRKVTRQLQSFIRKFWHFSRALSHIIAGARSWRFQLGLEGRKSASFLSCTSIK